MLVVDDDPDIRDAFEDVLRDEGYRVFSAADGKAALDLLDAGVQPNVILLDLMMPRLNGFDFLDQAREVLSAAGIRVIVVSANQGYRPEDLGVFDVVRKPTNVEQLVASVDRAVA